MVCTSLGIWNLSLESSSGLQTCMLNFNIKCHVDKAIYKFVHHADHVDVFLVSSFESLSLITGLEALVLKL